MRAKTNIGLEEMKAAESEARVEHCEALPCQKPCTLSHCRTGVVIFYMEALKE
jgi:hypothetical protein